MSVNLRTLVLTSNFMPMSLFPLYTIPAEEAIHRYINGNANVVEWYDRIIKTPSRNDLRWPSVIANNNEFSFKTNVRISKESLYYRDHCKCAYCGKELTISTLTKDHLIPTSKGGKHIWENVVACCKDCNSSKSDDTSKKWKPRIKPFKPTFYQMLDIRSKYPIMIDDESWRPFLPNWAGNVNVKGRD
jgi:5-methylcytosine-specific restriction endonuclease McrA